MMLLRSPAEYYYKFLVVHPDHYTPETIREKLAERDIDFISSSYLDGLRKKVRPPNPFYPNEEFHQASYQFLCREGLTGLFYPSKDTKLALDLLNVPRAREFVETMLLSHAPPEAIARAVGRFGIKCTGKAVSEYGHFFWNVSLLDSTQMKVLLQWRFERMFEANADGTRETGTALANASKKSSYQDPRKLAADLPFSPFSAMLVQMRMGVMPSRVDVATRMTEARNLATMRALESLHYGTPHDSNRALNYAMTAKIMNELLESVQQPDEALRKQLSSIALRTDDQSVPSIHQLSGGRHTVDLQPTPEGVYEPEPMGDSGDGG